MLKERHLYVAAVLMALGVVWLLWQPVAFIHVIYERDSNAGFNLYHASRLAAGLPLYTADLWHLNNYPFLSFAVTVATAWLTGTDLLTAGRWLSMVGLVLTGISVLIVTRRLQSTWAASTVASLLSVVFIFALTPERVAADDPQLLGMGITYLALAAYLCWPDRLDSIVVVAALVVCAGFIKHNLIVVPIVVTIDLLWRSHRKLMIWLMSIIAFILMLSLASWIVARSDFIPSVLLSPRRIRLHLLVNIFSYTVVTIPAVIALMAAVLGCGGRIYVLLAMSSIAEMTVFGIGEGVSYNVALEFAVALAIGCGLVMSCLRMRLSVPILAMASLPLVVSLMHMPSLAVLAQQFANDARWLRAQPGPALCESMLLCEVAGKGLLLQPYGTRQEVLAGNLDDSRLLDSIREEKIAVIQLRAAIYREGLPGVISPELQGFERFTRRFLHAVATHYHIAHASNNAVFYRPGSFSSADRLGNHHRTENRYVRVDNP